MKKTITLLLTAFFFVSCGENTETSTTETSDVVTIDTKDIKGTIEANPDETSNLNQNSNGVSSKGKTLIFKDKGEMNIYLVDTDLEETKSKMSGSPLFNEFEVLDEGENYFTYYIEKSGFGDKEVVKGYGFKVLFPDGEDTFVCIDGEGVKKFSPITTKEINQEFLAIALSFEK